MGNLENRPVIVVTGAAGALGAALVRYLAARGKTVIAIDRPQNSARLAEVSREAAGAVPIELDATSSETWSPVIERITNDYGAPAGAVLVAGGYVGGGRFFEGDSDARWRKMMDQNLESARVALLALLPPMVAARKGSVVLIGSRAAVRPWESKGAAAYAASKAAVLGLAQTIAAEVLEDGVRVNVVLPSTLDTPANRASMPSVDPTRWVTRESLCDVIGFLLSDAARDVSGAALPVYGRA
ncbi:MAG TPA: SDR family NAD(P)-dependent oxidoreductase [Polyangiaceae bacterium]|nr:SDR family NAD(P)-dependent oxidoreductase [Polyangiaceae bacterium]